MAIKKANHYWHFSVIETSPRRSFLACTYICSNGHSASDHSGYIRASTNLSHDEAFTHANMINFRAKYGGDVWEYLRAYGILYERPVKDEYLTSRIKAGK